MKKTLLFLLTTTFLSQFITAQDATGLNFDGQVANWDYIEVPDNNLLDFTTSFTFEAWVNFDQINRTTDGWDWQCIFAKSRYTESYGLMLLTDGVTKLLRFYHAGFGTGFTDYNWSAVSAGQWYHVAVALSSAEANIYIDGLSIQNQTATGSLSPNNSPLRIGAGATVGGDPYPMQGMMDEVRFWNYARSASEIVDAKDCELDGDETGLVLNFNLNQGVLDSDNTSITTVTDKTANNLDGNLTGFELTSIEGNFIDSSTNGISGVCSTLSVDEFYFNGDVTLAPNPTEDGAFRVECFGCAEIRAISVYNLSGRLIKEFRQSFEDQSLDISELASGAYIVEIKGARGSVSKKLFKR